MRKDKMTWEEIDKNYLSRFIVGAVALIFIIADAILIKEMEIKQMIAYLNISGIVGIIFIIVVVFILAVDLLKK